MDIGLQGMYFSRYSERSEESSYCRVSISKAHCTKVNSHAAQRLSVIAPTVNR